MAVLYSTGCSRCVALERMLTNKGVNFNICDDIDTMKSKGIMSVPVLEVGDKMYGFSEAISAIRSGGL